MFPCGGDVLFHFNRIEMFDLKNDEFHASEIIIAVRLLHRKKKNPSRSETGEYAKYNIETMVKGQN